MADKKLEKALYGPSTWEVALGAVLGLLLGIVVACVYLVFRPILMVKDLPKEPAIGAVYLLTGGQKPKEAPKNTVYFLSGSQDANKAKAWKTKQQKFLGTGAGEIILTEDELNAWALSLGAPASTTGPAPKGAPAKPGAPPPAKPGAPPVAPTPAAAPGGLITPATPNFRLHDGKMQITVKCTVNVAGFTADFLVVTVGGFRKENDHFTFVPETFYLGSCPLHRLPATVAPVMKKIIDAATVPDEVRAAWAKLSDISFVNGMLKLAMQ